VDEAHRESAERTRAMIQRGDRGAFRAVLRGVPAPARDAWVDRVLGLELPPDDGPELPRGGVPYLPCPVDALLRLVEHAPVRTADRFVDIGSGTGRAAAVVHLLTGAPAMGVEVQPALVAAARDLVARLRLSAVTFVQGDAACTPLPDGSVFFLYCPFSGERLATVLDGLGAQARTHPIAVCCVDLPLPPCPWLELASPAWPDLTIHHSRPALVSRS
jgi:SAM-dependent methyltransferase